MKSTHAPTKASDVERFTRLLARCQRPVFLYAVGLLHNAADAEDVLQETNVVLWQKFRQYQPGTDFVSWACRIAYYEVLKLCEKKAREDRLFSDGFLEVLAAESQRCVSELDDRRDALHDCLGKLSPNDNRLVELRYQPEATTRSVAEALGRSVQGTRRALHRIRTGLLGCVRRTLTAREHR
ncbi:MAG: sigma-70 family RNA polymerase sigma factor [Planctomycetota bacterium]